MEQVLPQLVAALVGGGSQAVSAVLMLIIGALYYERRRLLSEVKTKENRIDKIVDDYYKGYLQVNEALSNIKQILALKILP